MTAGSIIILLIIILGIISIIGAVYFVEKRKRIKHSRPSATSLSKNPDPIPDNNKLFEGVKTNNRNNQYKLVCMGTNLEVQSTFLGDFWRVEKHAIRLAQSYRREVTIYKQSEDGWVVWGKVSIHGQVKYIYGGEN